MDLSMTPWFVEILEKGNKSHVTWLLISCLMRNIVKRFDAIIFGGAVRDLILHSNASRKFYKLYTQLLYEKAMSETNESPTPESGETKTKKVQPIPDYKAIADKYNDPTIYPELSDRFLLPRDIDFFMTKTNYYYFKKYLYKRGYYFKVQKNYDLSYVNHNLNHGDYTLNKIEIIYFDKKNNNTYLIHLDIILCNEIGIPQMDADFSVNKLLMSKKGIKHL